MCRDHRHLTTCQKQPITGVEVYGMGGSGTCVGTTDVSPPVKNRQNKPAGQVDILNRVEVRVTGDPGHV